jgi:carboxypeptidase C (cathepsin A)
MDASAAAAYASPEDVPLIVWTNGGPGCTAMEGATTENGPLVLYRIKESYELATGQLSDNAYAWNKQGHVLYVDQPKGVGNSFGANKCPSSVEAGKDIVTFLQGWLQLFPQYATNKLVVSGESYGGHYVPAWANAILDHNENGASPSLNLKGIAIGNGCINNTVQDTTKFVEFLHANNLIPADAAPKSQVGANAQMEAYIGYNPNFYDYRVRDISCAGCYSYNYTEWSYWFLRADVIESLNICGGAGYDAFAGAAGG